LSTASSFPTSQSATRSVTRWLTNPEIWGSRPHYLPVWRLNSRRLRTSRGQPWMASDRGTGDPPQITTTSEPLSAATGFISNDPASGPAQGTRPSSSGHAEAVRAILSRTAVARSEGFLRPIADTPPRTPASPRLGA
jgi:hypothetical protein